MQSKAKLGFTATTSRQAKRGSGNLVNTIGNFVEKPG